MLSPQALPQGALDHSARRLFLSSSCTHLISISHPQEEACGPQTCGIDHPQERSHGVTTVPKDTVFFYIFLLFLTSALVKEPHCNTTHSYLLAREEDDRRDSERDIKEVAVGWYGCLCTTSPSSWRLSEIIGRWEICETWRRIKELNRIKI